MTYTRDGLPYEVSPGGLALSPDGRILAAGMESELEALVALWDITDGRLLQTLKTGDNDDITTLAFHPSDNFLVGGSFNNGKVWFWDLDNGHLFNTWEPGCKDRPHDLAFSPDGTILFAGYGFYGLYGWDVKQRKEISKPTGDLWANRVSIAPDGLSLAVGHFGPVGLRTVQILEMNTWRALHEFSGDSDILTGSFSSNGRLLTTMESYGDVSIWNVASGKLQYTL
ncbi:hypothetical protein KDK_47030 [Dictyobacter kobayashii]|uniref:Uncharacterized protein n=1 Tax=Dictyobacter kobayashii TaxID=2014872 RepID=A0A402AP12_9CHLR|nr:hypothetical protein KDK_47030 [Dictyobacter kobayashii]